MAWLRLENEKEVLLRIAAGDERAFHTLYEASSGPLYQAMRRYAGDDDSTLDLLQDVYARVWMNRASLATVRSARDYLFITARNTAFNHFKRQLLERKSRVIFVRGSGGDPIQPDNELEHKDYAELLQQAVDRLPPQQRQVYMLAELQELSQDEIAGQMQLSKFTVKRHLALARETVRRYMLQYTHPMVAIPVGWLLYDLLSVR